MFLGWRVKARNLLLKACGAESEHYKEFERLEANPGMFAASSHSFMQRLKAVFLAAKEDYEGGFETSSSRRPASQASTPDASICSKVTPSAPGAPALSRPGSNVSNAPVSVVDQQAAKRLLFKSLEGRLVVREFGNLLGEFKTQGLNALRFEPHHCRSAVPLRLLDCSGRRSRGQAFQPTFAGCRLRRRPIWPVLAIFSTLPVP